MNNMFTQLWQFVVFLGMIILILFLIGIIFAIIDTIYKNIKMSVIEKNVMLALDKELNKENCKIEIEKIDKETLDKLKEEDV